MAKYGIDAFDVKLDTMLQLNSSKVPAQEEVYSLVISAGGTGLDALLETKGMINKTCCLDDAHKNLPTDHVKYLCFDTDSASLNRVGSPETGGAALDNLAGEFVQMEAPTMAHFLSEAYRSQVPSYISSWLDFSINPSTGASGAGGIRQCGRLLMFQNIERVRNAISSAITVMAADKNMKKLNIYLLAGIGGGTGSGTFIDLAYIARQVAEEHAENKVTMYGYLFMPDVNLSRPMPENNQAYIRKNGYAALKELDYLMNMSQDGGKFVQQYSPAYTIDTERQPFDYVHLIGSSGSDGFILKDPYRQGMRAVAQSIVSFVANEQKEGKMIEVAMKSHYDNIHNATEQHVRRFPERHNPYLALGTYSYELPIDQILLYVTSLLFEKMDSMFNVELDQNEINRAYATLGLTPQALQASLVGNHAQLAPAGTKWEDLFGRNPKLNLSGFCEKWITQTAHDIEGRAKGVIKEFPEHFKDATEKWFTDPKYGPIWINHLIVIQDGSHTGLAARLRRDMEICGSRATELKTEIEKIRATRAKAEGDCRSAGPIMGGREEKTKSYIELVNHYADLCANLAAVQQMHEIYSACLDEILNQNNKMFKVVVEVLEGLKDICHKNADILTQTALTNAGTTFTWQPISIPDVSDAIKKAFDAKGDAAQTISTFTTALLSHAYEWSEGTVDVKGFIRDYLDSNLSDIANGSLEDYVINALKGADLKTSVLQTLAPNTTLKSVPLLPITGTADVGGKFWLVSIPFSCTQILEAYKDYKAADPALSATLTIQPSGINSRIFAQSILGSVPLSAYAPLTSYELTYLNPNGNKGVHLYMGKDVNWRDLPCPIPYRARPKQLNAYPAAIKETEDKARAVYDKCRDFPIIRIESNGIQNVYALHIAKLPDLEAKYGDAAMRDESGRYDVTKLQSAVEELQDYLKNGLPDIDLTDEIHHNTYAVAICGTADEKQDETARESLVGEYNNLRRAQKEIEKYEKLQAYLTALQQKVESTAGVARAARRLVVLLISGIVAVEHAEDGSTAYVYKNGDNKRVLVKIGNRMGYRELLLSQTYEALAGDENAMRRDLYQRIGSQADKAFKLMDANADSRQAKMDKLQALLKGVQQRLQRISDDVMDGVADDGIDRDSISFYEKIVSTIKREIRDLSDRMDTDMNGTEDFGF